MERVEVEYAGTLTSLPLAYCIAVVVVGIVLAVLYGRLVVDPASYVIPDFPVNPIPIIALIVYEILILPWTYKYNKVYGLLRTPGILVLIVATIFQESSTHIALAVAGTLVLIVEAKILVELAYRTQRVVMVLAGIIKGVVAVLAGVYAIALVVPALKNSIITITQFLLALTPFLVLGIWLFTVIYLLTITRRLSSLAITVIPLTLLAIMLLVLAFIYIQPAISNPKLTLRIYGDVVRALSLTAIVIVLLTSYIRR